MGQVFAGLDVGSRSCHLVAMDKDKVVLHDRRFDTSEMNLITAFEEINGEVHVHLEAGELATWIRRMLRNGQVLNFLPIESTI